MSPSLQTRLKALVDRYTPSGWYSAYELDGEEDIGTFDLPLDRAQVQLHNVGYGLLPTVLGIRLSAAKRHPETGKLHDATRRKVPRTKAETARTGELVRDTELADYEHERLQYHVHLFARDDGTTDVYSHLELRSDLHPVGTEDWSEAIGRLMIHYNPRYDSTLLEGATEPKLEQLL
jgi:hypothetical protein